MMAMKDLFNLVNDAFMNRNKSTEESREIEVPKEAAEDTRVLPGSNSSSASKLNRNLTLLSSLEPYQHLLPDLCGMDLTQHKKLQCGGHVDVIRTLIQAGADVNALSSTKNTALIYACASGHLECIKELLASGNCDLSLRNEAGHDALMEAANIGNVTIMKILVEHGAKPTYIIDSEDYKESALTLASYKGHCEVVEFLLSLMPQEKNSQEEEELHTALMEAAMDGHIEVAKLLLAAGSKVNLSTESFENPLTLASCGGHLEYVKLLCDAGALLEEPNDEGFTPLMEASREGHHDIVEYLLDRGANVNSKTEDGLETSLTLAASGGFLDVVELLVNRGGDLTLGERTPLYEACQEGRVIVSKFIISCLQKSHPLADIQKDLNEALFCAVNIGNEELCDLLIESGAQIDCFSKENRTPLMEASRQNFLNIVELLIKRGADVNKIAPSVSKDLEPINRCSLKSHKNSKKLTQKDCCPALKCPCCIPPSLQKSAKEVCTAAGITTGSYSTTNSQMNIAAIPFSSVCSHSTVNPANAASGIKRPAAPSRSNSPNAHKCSTQKTSSSKLNHVSVAHKHPRSMSTSSSSATLSDPSAWMENASACDTQNNDTALTLACDGGHKDLVAFLIKRGAHLEHRDKKGFTPLILAATKGYEEICRLLIEGGALPDAQADRTKDTALSMSCGGGKSNVVALLLKHGANKEHRNLSDYTPLSLAASGGHVDVMQLLLTHGAEINSRTNSKLGISPLMLSAMNGHEEATSLLLENGSDINAQIETNKNTALTLACFQGRVEVTQLLINYGANVEHRAKTGLTPIMEAANGGYVEVGRVLLQANADVNTSPVPTSRDTSLTIAADKGHHAFVALLLDYGAQINARNKKGCTALWLACCGGHLETTRVLIEHKADSELQDNRKLTPLMIAFRKGHFKVVEYMVDYVLQFPSDGDCQRYILTLTNHELIDKCTQCMQFIKEAKAKQAEQANKAAASLLEMLAKEEALEESKKRTKQRQKEKKKAKKQAKKDEEDSFDNNNNGFTADNETDLDIKLEKVSLKPLQPVLNENPGTQQKFRENYNQEPLAQSIDQAQFQRNDNNEEHQFNNKLQKENIKVLATKTKEIKRSRVTSKKDNTNVNAFSTITTPNNQRISAVISKNSEDEWLTANKKKSTVTKPFEPKHVSVANMITTTIENSEVISTAIPSNVSPSAPSMMQIPPLFPDDVFINEHLSAVNIRRPSLQVLNIASSSIPRVIGRGGSNVNTIREATGAHVEVEKQCLRKEQTTRKITIKGATEAVKNAVMMIDLLMKDHNMLVTDIVDRVISSTTSKSSPSLSTSTDTTNSGVSTHYIASKEEVQKSPKQVPKIVDARTIAMKNSPVSIKTLKSVVSSNSPQVQTTPSTNIWQKRAEAAIRENKNPQLNLTIGEKPFINHSYDGVSSALRSTNVVSTIDLKLISGKRQGFEASDNINELTALAKEEHQRKAPGYARPQSSLLSQSHHNSSGKSSNAAASSPLDTIAARWTSNTLLEESDSPITGNIQNSWSYLLKERKIFHNNQYGINFSECFNNKQ